jgi:hypothetical protein
MKCKFASCLFGTFMLINMLYYVYRNYDHGTYKKPLPFSSALSILFYYGFIKELITGSPTISDNNNKRTGSVSKRTWKWNQQFSRISRFFFGTQFL